MFRSDNATGCVIKGNCHHTFSMKGLPVLPCC